MGSVVDYIDCPHCGEEAWSDFYYKTGEEYVRCNHCGYYRDAALKRDDGGQLITKDGSDRIEFDNLIMEYNECTNPYGAYRYKFNGNIGTTCGTLINEQSALDFEDMVFSHTEPKITFATISRLVDGEIVEKILINDKNENENG
jgi:hypothetical protein